MSILECMICSFVWVSLYVLSDGRLIAFRTGEKKGARLILLVCHLSQKSAVSIAQLQAWIHLQLEIGRFSAILFNCTDSLKNLIFDEASLMLATEHDDLHAIHSACNSLLTILLVVCAPLDSLHTGMFKIVIIINLFILISIQKNI